MCEQITSNSLKNEIANKLDGQTNERCQIVTVT